jgi:RNA polymerase sigma-70 factor (ECF subfamily)
MRLKSEQASEPTDSAADDYALMAGVRARDAGAMAALFDRYSGLVYGLCLRALREPRDAEDLLIDIFAEVWEKGDRYDPARGSPVGHLMGLARSRVVDRLRSRRSAAGAGARAAAEMEAAADVAGNGTGPVEVAINSEQRERVVAALNSLAADQRQALELAYFEALSHAEVARKLEQPLGTVKSRIRQALIQLRTLLARPD